MSQLDEVLNLAADNTASEFALSGESLAVLFYAMDFVQTLEAWKDFSDEEISSSDIDQIKALVDNAIDSLMRPIMTTPIGSIQMFGSNTIPDKWLLCDSMPISRVDYAELFAIIGTNFGIGDGTTTFNLPGFIARSPMGVHDPGLIALGQERGEQNHLLTVNQLPSHSHELERIGGASSGVLGYALASLTTQFVFRQTLNTGGNQPHNNIHPVLGVNFIIYAGV